MTDLDRIIAEMREHADDRQMIQGVETRNEKMIRAFADRLAALARAEPVAHLYQGDCPDEWQPDARDSECPACQAMTTTHAPAKAREDEPSLGLLMSIAIRLDHALGLPGYHDQFGGPGTHAARVRMAIADARRAWEEVTGNGFYRPEKEGEYAALATFAEGKNG